jgi:glycosyltransferase involved in cell wall biosynthesis
MSKIFFAVNNSYPNVGGSEKVVQQVSEGLHNQYGHECVVLSKSVKKKELIHNGVKIIPLSPSGRGFINQVQTQSPDHLFVYGDLFSYWKEVVKFSNSLDCGKSIALVGMNNMIRNRSLFNSFLSKTESFNVITHSEKYQDSLMCKRYKIPFTVIPNSVDDSEFENCKFDFRKFYNIETSKILLCVSNFFPGKGQDNIIPILNNIYSEFKDFTAIFISSLKGFAFSQVIKNQFVMKLKNVPFKYKVLCDIPREHTVGAFLDSDVFVFPSKKEVAPLVVLESMNAGLPWVSLNVGNTPDLEGGICIKAENKDADDNIVYTKKVENDFSNSIKKIIFDEELKKELGIKGRKMIQESFCFDSVLNKYNRIFSKGN